MLEPFKLVKPAPLPCSAVATNVPATVTVEPAWLTKLLAMLPAPVKTGNTPAVPPLVVTPPPTPAQLPDISQTVLPFCSMDTALTLVAATPANVLLPVKVLLVFLSGTLDDKRASARVPELRLLASVK